MYILREKVTFSGGELGGRLICTVSFPKLFSLVLFDEIQVRAIFDYEILSIYFD